MNKAFYLYSINKHLLKTIKMKIILSTTYQGYYWRKNNNLAPFPTLRNAQQIIQNLQNINHICPLVAIGYYRGAQNNYNYDYIKIRGAEINAQGHIIVTHDFINSSHTRSIDLQNLLPPGSGSLFSIFNEDAIIENILHSLNEVFPTIGGNSVNINPIQRTSVEPPFISYIGNNFLDLLQNNLSNDEFEDRVYELLVALGFKVEQRGKLVFGSFPDGYAKIDDKNILVYDCKNSNNFILTQQAINSMNNYLQDAHLKFPNCNLIPVFIARGYNINNARSGFFFYKIKPLLYLLYKKLKRGIDFNLNNLLPIIRNRQDVDEITIDNNF